MFALSGATSNIYTGSRLLYGMTLDKQAPQILRRVTAGGRPLMALGACAVWSFLSYAGEDENSTNEGKIYWPQNTRHC
jgi:yeast amino acid transporter